MTLLALSFIYPNKLTEFLDDELSEKLIQSYRDDLDFQNLIDLVQVSFGFCLVWNPNNSVQYPFAFVARL